MPSPDPIPPAPLAPPPEDFDLATPEEVAARRFKRRLLIGGGVLTVLLGLGAWQGHPVAGAIKGWQARRTAAEALRLLDANQPEPAVGKLQDALTLRGMDPEVRRTAAVFLTRVGHGHEAVGFWKQVEAGRPLTHDEQRDFAADLLATGDVAGGGPATARRVARGERRAARRTGRWGCGSPARRAMARRRPRSPSGWSTRRRRGGECPAAAGGRRDAARRWRPGGLGGG